MEQPRAMTWLFPLKLKILGPTDNSDSFKNINITDEVEIPVGQHVGAFGVERRYDIHRGVDLYCLEGTPVYAVEDGEVVEVSPWTGPKAGYPWWLDTDAVFIKGRYGNVAYGEIKPCGYLKVGKKVFEGQLIGFVKRVLKNDKGRPTSMLHLQMYKHGVTETGGWKLNKPQPDSLLDPTEYLLTAKEQY
jgi:murein DD-endopeptidase MepM/ murein hydrolase activator NlpD